MKTESTQKLVEAIQTVARGETALSHTLSSRLLNQMVRGESTKTTSPLDQLTDRELEVFQMLGQGKSLDDIQEELSLSRKTIETYRRRAKEKLDFDNVSQLLRYAVWWTHGRGTNTMDPQQSPLPEPMG
jgi:DNA-binding NarL/FixJ family response regulator